MPYKVKDVQVGDQAPEGVVLSGYVQMLYQVRKPDGGTKWINRKARFTEDAPADLSFLDGDLELTRE